MRTGADQLTISQINQDLILQTIKKRKRITRASISQELHLSPLSVSSNIEKLLQKNLVLEYSMDNMEGPGRRGKLLGLNPDFAYIVCIDLSSPTLTIGLGNVNEEIIECTPYDRIQGIEAPKLLACVKNGISDLLMRRNLTLEQVGAIIVCSPGVINEYAQKIEYAPQFPGWEGTNVWSELRKEYGDRLILMNDVNAIALGELQVGIGRYYKSFVYINVDVGIGGGIIIDHHLLEGENLAAGELGFMITALDQLNHHTPERGALEGQISIQALRERLASRLKMPLHEVTLPVINRLCYEGDPVVMEEIQLLIKMLAMCVVNISAVLNVPVICLGGMLLELNVDVAQKISNYIQGLIPYPPHICNSQLGSTGFLHGALYLGAERILKQATKEHV